jgi:beta-glucanase (GH16 family)
MSGLGWPMRTGRMSFQSPQYRVALACATIAIGLLPLTLLPVPAEASGGGQGKAAAVKKKCKKRGRSAGRKCKGRRGGGSSQISSTPPATAVAAATPPAQPAEPDPAPNPDPVADACGAPIAKSTGGYWKCTFADDFDGSSLDLTKWIPQRTDTSGYMNGHAACFTDSPNNVSVSDGTLKLTAREEPAPFSCGGDFTTRYTSGMVSTAQGRFSQTYGRFEVRAKIPPAQVKGLQTSLWLWPDDATKYGPWPSSGEIDIAEMFSEYPDRAIPYVHTGVAAADSQVTNTSCTISNLAEFHTYTLEWTAGSLTIGYDGATCLVYDLTPASGGQPFDQPFFIALTQALGVGTNEFEPETTPLPATTEVDYVRAWS